MKKQNVFSPFSAHPTKLSQHKDRTEKISNNFQQQKGILSFSLKTNYYVDQNECLQLKLDLEVIEALEDFFEFYAICFSCAFISKWQYTFI